MPFELGLAVAAAEHRKKDGKHHWVVLEGERYRLQKSLSDLNGFDPFIHGGTISGLLRVLSDAFDKTAAAVSRDHMMKLYGLLRLFALNLKAQERSDDLYRPSAFRKLVFAASASARLVQA